MEFGEELREGIGLEGFDLDFAGGDEATELLAPFEHVADFGAVVGWPVERRLGHFLVPDRNAESGSKRLELVLVQLLLLVGDVLAFTRLADPVSLDRPRQDNCRLTRMRHRGVVGRVDLDRVVPAERQLLQLLVRQVLDHVEQPGVFAPELLPDVLTGLDGVLLILAIDYFAHALDEQSVLILFEQRVPLGAPDHLDDVPAGAAEDGLELLNDLAVAANRTVEPLQVAVDDEDQIVEFFARGQRDRAECLGFVGLAVAEERPHLGVRSLLQAAIFQIAHEARLIDRLDRTEAHRHRGELPEVGHQPGMRIRREPAARLQLSAEVLQLLGRQTSLEERPGVDARCRVSLEIDDVAVVVVALALEEVVEPHLIERGRRCEGRDVTADPVFRLVRLDDHRERVPPDQALDAPFDFTTAWKRRLIGWRDGVDVGGIGGEGLGDAAALGVIAELAKQAADSSGPAGLEHIVERLEPLAGLERLDFRGVLGCCVTHGSSKQLILVSVAVPMKPVSANVYPRVTAASLSARLADVHHAIVSCERCPRLRAYCRTVAQEKKRAYRTETYWGRPVPGFGDPDARMLLVGLAPAAHGANRTGRVFTGDGVGGSGDFLMSALHRTGFANIPTSRRVDDGLTLSGRVHRRRGALCAAGQQTSARGDRALSRSPGRGGQRAVACARDRRARQDRVRRVAAAAATAWRSREAASAVCARCRRAHEGWSARTACTARVLSPKPAEHEYGKADAGDDGEGIQEGEKDVVEAGLKTRLYSVIYYLTAPALNLKPACGSPSRYSRGTACSSRLRCRQPSARPSRHPLPPQPLRRQSPYAPTPQLHRIVLLLGRPELLDVGEGRRGALAGATASAATPALSAFCNSPFA